jgi:GDP/UDP-N,N'-diacetylbacillosamine 2-epimerase (hydrolysing)
MTIKLLIPIGCRSDEGLSKPVIDRLLKENWCDVKTVSLVPQNFIKSYEIINSITERYDYILITGDRVEMCAAACAAFHNNTRIIHLYAGCKNNIGTYDDIDRHCITLWSDVQLCENEFAKSVVEKILMEMKTPNAHVVGITHLDDIKLDMSIVPKSCHNGIDPIEYNLVLYNLPTKGSEREIQNELNEIGQLIKDRYTILIGGNPDGEHWNQLISSCDVHYKLLPRNTFLGLLKNCSKLITNSSVAIYEAPYFLHPYQIIRIGRRNESRGMVDCKPGGSDRIVEIIKSETIGDSI